MVEYIYHNPVGGTFKPENSNMKECSPQRELRVVTDVPWPSLLQTKPWGYPNQPHLTCAETVDKLDLSTTQQISQGPRHRKCPGILHPCFLPYVSTWTDATVMMYDCLSRRQRCSWQEIREDTGNTSSSSTSGTAKRSSPRRSRRVSSTTQCSCHEMRGCHNLCTYWALIWLALSSQVSFIS